MKNGEIEVANTKFKFLNILLQWMVGSLLLLLFTQFQSLVVKTEAPVVITKLGLNLVTKFGPYAP
jgi:hypothetical protein